MLASRQYYRNSFQGWNLHKNSSLRLFPVDLYSMLAFFLPRGGCEILYRVILQGACAHSYLSNSHVDKEKTLGKRRVCVESLPRDIGSSANGGGYVKPLSFGLVVFFSIYIHGNLRMIYGIVFYPPSDGKLCSC